ncbi:MG2 domain-containing protein, partial [Carboxylicivirga linearis]
MKLTNPKPSFITIAFLVLISLTLVSPVSAQNWEDIIKKLQLHQTLQHNEKVFVQTDRPIYLPGETLWFNAFIINAATQELNQTEVVLHVELLNPNKSIFLKEMFKIENGLAAGQLELKENTKPGKYYLVAYTNWMRNAGSEYYFSKEIIVSGEGERSHSTGISASSQQNNKLANEIGEVSEVKQQLQIEFYPEGGDLVAGISSKVAFEVRDALGMPQSFNGILVDDKGQIVTAAKTMWRGKGVFTLTPETNKQYFIKEVGQSDSLQTYPLSDALSEGLAMTVVDQDIENPLTITVSKSGSIADTTLFLLATQNGKVKDALIINMSGRETLTTELAKTEFNSGIVQLTLFDQNQMARAERLVFIKKEDALNIAINEDKLPEGSRDSVLLTMLVTSSDGDPVEGNFSIAVTDATRVPDKAYGSANINQYLSLYSDLPGLKLNDPILFEDTGESNFKSELLMLTNGWRRYQWEEVLTDSLTIPDYLEEPGIYVKGKVTSLWGKDNVPKGAEVTMIAGNVFDSYNDKLDENGEFTFIMHDFYDSKKVTFQTKNQKGKKKDFEIDILTNYQSDTIDQFDYLGQANSNDISLVNIDIHDIQISQDVLQKELNRVVVEDTFMVTTDVSIKEVDVSAESKKSTKAQMNEKYGVPNSSIGKIKVEELMEENSRYDGLFSLIYEAFPDLRISKYNVDKNEIEFKKANTHGFKFGTSGGLSNYNVNSEEHTDIQVIPEISFQLIGKQRHRFFVFVDGQMIAASNIRGVIRKAYRNYTLDDLIAIDPKDVQSIDLLFPDSELAKARLTDEARYYNGGDEIDRTVPGGINPFKYQSEIISTPVAVLSIYTKAGGGLYSTAAYKGISNVTIQGYKRTKEFYHYDYSTAFKDSV